MRINNGRWKAGALMRRTQLLVDVSVGHDSVPQELEQSDAEAISRGEVQVYYVDVHVVAVGRCPVTEGRASLSGILAESDDDEHLHRVTEELVQEATNQALLGGAEAVIP